MTQLQSLIDKKDNFEIIRDQIAAILATEVAQQKVYAANEGKDPLEWDLRVFIERAAPWEVVLNDPTDADDRRPVVNVYYDNTSLDTGASNVVKRQTVNSTFNIDCIGFGLSREDGAGHIPGDRDAALQAQRAARLVRNVLMSSYYTTLRLTGVVGQRVFRSITSLQPPLDATQVQKVSAVRLAFDVKHEELSPQYEGQPLELITTQTTIDPSGEVFAADYDFSS